MTNEMVYMNNKPKSPWIGVGESGNWNNVDEAMNICGLNFEVNSKHMSIDYEEDGMTYYETVPGYKATVRTDTHQPLGVVSNTYKVVQNNDVFHLLDPFVEAGGVVTAGGMTKQGLCFMVASLGTCNAGGDEYTVNVMATNSFNGRFPASLIWSPVRIVCQNMYRSLLNESDNVARFRHSLNAHGRIESLKSAYEVFLDFDDMFTSKIETLKSRKATHSIEEFVELMFPYTVHDVDSSRYESSRERIDEKREYYINRYYNSSTNSDHGTCFALVNAYYDYISHDVPVRKTEEEYRNSRLSKIVGGTMVKPALMSFMCE